MLIWEEDSDVLAAEVLCSGAGPDGLAEEVADVLARAPEEVVACSRVARSGLVPRAAYPAAALVTNVENKPGREGCICGVGIGGNGGIDGGEGGSWPEGGVQRPGDVGLVGPRASSRMRQMIKARAMSLDTEIEKVVLSLALARGEVLVVAGAGYRRAWLRASRSMSRASDGCFSLPSLVSASWYSTPQLPLRM